MEESEEREESRSWQKRMSWAECAEPHKTVLNTIASHWIEGEISNGEVALEALRERARIVDQLRGAREARSRPPKELEAVSRELDILIEAIADAERESKIDSPETRRIFFTTCLKQARAEMGHRGP